MKLDGKVCVVTGGLSGIGRAVVEEYAREGGRVAVLDMDGDAADAYAQDLRSRGIDAIAAACDVASRESVSAAAAEVESTMGPCEVLVNNAGLALIGPSVDFPEAKWRQSIDVMQTGTFFCCQAFGSQMIARGGGTIVNVSWMNARTAFPMRLAFSSAKAAIAAMTEVLAVEWAEHGIRVNAVGPGIIRTELVDRGVKDGLVHETAYIERTPMKRLGRPEEVAKAALFLASEQDAGFITGQLLVVDGGWSSYGYVLA